MALEKAWKTLGIFFSYFVATVIGNQLTSFQTKEDDNDDETLN